MTTVDVPPDSPFGPANLPYGVFAPDGGGPRVGVRLGDHVIDLAAALGTRGSDAVLAAPTLNPLMAQGPAGSRSAT